MSNLERTGSNKWLFFALLSTIAMLLYAYFVLGHFSQCYVSQEGPNAIGLMFGYTTQDVISFLSTRAKDELICYTRFIRIWDTAFPVIYTLMHVTWIIFLFKRWKLVLVIPILHMITDWIENTVEIMIVETYLNSGKVAEPLVSLGSTLTITKWILSIVVYIIILVAVGLKLKNYFGNKPDSKEATP